MHIVVECDVKLWYANNAKKGKLSWSNDVKLLNCEKIIDVVADRYKYLDTLKCQKPRWNERNP